MDNPRSEKVAIVDEIAARLTEAKAIFVSEYRGLNVTALATLRGSLRNSGAEHKVYKNTLARFAAEKTGLTILTDLLVGPTALTFVGDDSVAAAKALRDVARTHPQLVLKGGALGDKPLTAADITALADLPSREQLLAMFAGALQAPLVKTAGLLQALPRNLAYGLSALVDQKTAAEAA